MAGPLEVPQGADDLYLARAAGHGCVTPLRPIMTGDVFQGVAIPGVERCEDDDQRLAMVVSHPCSMRSGYALKDFVQVIRVIKCDPINLEAWSRHYFDRIPLPELTVPVDPDDISGDDPEAELETRIQEGAHAALFEMRGRVPSSRLDLGDRIACLTELGIAYLHQRMSHYDSRHSVAVEDYVKVSRAVLAEIELWEQWNESLIDESLSDPKKLAEELDRVGEIFDEELSKKRPLPSGKKGAFYNLRDQLKVDKTHAKARREILRILREKYGRTKEF